VSPGRNTVKKKSRPKAATTKPERKAKGKSKGAPKSTKAKAPPRPPGSHPEPTVEGKPGNQDKMYGGFVLRPYDHDMRGALAAVYGSELRKVIFDKPIKTAVATGTGSANVQDQDTRMVAKLRRHLWALGFWVFPRQYVDGVAEPEESDTFDWRTEWAVREFQIAAAMPNVAAQDVKKKPSEEECKTKGKYLSTLSAKKNDQILDEHPSGVVTEKTAATIKYWLDHQYRCPLVIQAFRMKDESGPENQGETGKKEKKKPKGKHAKRVRDVVHTENIWGHDEVVTPSKKIPDVQMYAWDFSGHYDFPEGHLNEAIYVGHYQAKPPFGGPISKTTESWTEASLTPESWQGQSWTEMDANHKSTWRAIMAVAAQECGGGLDIVNFWDNCLGSAGHYHWTMPKSDGSGGEFCGLIAMLEAKFPDAFAKCFSTFGLWGPRWVGSAASDAREQLHPGATYGGFLYTKGEDGKFLRQPEKGRFAEGSWLRSWQAAYRLQMAARTRPDYRKAMWEYALLRIKGIRTMSEVDAWLPAGCKTPGKRVTLADIFTSERGMAFALRLHVWRPAGLIVGSKGKNGKGLPILHDALNKLMADGTLMTEDGTPMEDDQGGVLKWEIPIETWKDPHESILLDTMLELTGQYTKPGAKGSLQRARFWPLVVDKDAPYALLLAKAEADNVASPKLAVRTNTSGLPSPPKRQKGQEEAVRRDLAEFQPSPVRGSFLLAE
jgi:hypothetical protein